ncbi:hypothetical protein Rrhod_0723 [Rhodococcus rhodnii LMG 5362]|uniref:Phage terminase n=1 Tax=Rhodococcus rhodnii LMG 5362 TaxID=1273125 RepID=R7WUV4_9NOCA|nr:terminase family protein [Rhodococcus rhodnii]EOM77914.1 hypothetical protein Rrhod_0723 [Rhodococcus rhodnii LMG 5362]
MIQPEGIVSTEWPSVRDTCSRLGWGFDAWQDGAGRLILAKRGDGLYAADQILVSIPRQVGKTYLFAAIVFALCLLHPNLTVIWTAHRVKTAKETFNSMSGMATQPKVAAHIGQIIRARGDEAILFGNGSRILFGARESGFGRGFTDVDVLVFDEAQILGESAMEDMVAAQNVAANPLTILTGTPPRPRDPGEVFTNARQEALDGDSDEVLYIELSADRGADPLDRDQWRKANPSFPHRTSERAMLRMKKNLSESSFVREALGVWDEVSVHRAVIRATDWAALSDIGPESDVRPDALSIDMSHAREISVCACWVEGERAHVEEVWAGIDVAAAVDWVASRVRRRTPVAIDAASPASSMVPALRSRRVTVNQTTAGDMAKACGLVVDRSAAQTVTHGGQQSVNDALEGARKRPIRDAGGWGWDRRDESVSIAPIVSWSLALFMGTVSTKQARPVRAAAPRAQNSRRSSRGRRAVLLQ